MSLILAIVAGLGVEPAEAAFRWTWDHPRVHHRVVEPPPDCAQIKEAVVVLDQATLERSLKSSTSRQRAIIRKCLDAR